MPEINTDITAQLDALAAKATETLEWWDSLTVVQQERFDALRDISVDASVVRTLIAKHREDAATIAALREVAAFADVADNVLTGVRSLDVSRDGQAAVTSAYEGLSAAHDALHTALANLKGAHNAE